jgi:hypothetical protein
MKYVVMASTAVSLLLAVQAWAEGPNKKEGGLTTQSNHEGRGNQKASSRESETDKGEREKGSQGEVSASGGAGGESTGRSGWASNLFHDIVSDDSRPAYPSSGNVHGAPGPIAGAGLPFLAVGYGVYWLIKRRKGRVG